MVGLALLGMPGAANATLLNFSYTKADGSVLSGMLDGVIQPNADDVVVNSMMGVEFDASPLAFSFTFFESREEAAGGPSADPIVSFSGLFMDIIACETSGCIEGFSLTTAEPSCGDPGFAASFTDADCYVASRWSLTTKQVPEPATLALFAIALAGLGFMTRRRRVV